MAGHSRPKDGVASLAYVPAIHVVLCRQNVDARHKAGHDVESHEGRTLKIGILLGDDIGLEVVPESVKVMKAAAAKTGLAIDWRELPIGKAGHEQHGNTLPKITEETLHTLDGWIMGPIGHNAYPRGDMTWVMGRNSICSRRCAPRCRIRRFPRCTKMSTSPYSAN
jgi:Isocitrate/isopropylmalate dehydrogenase